MTSGVESDMVVVIAVAKGGFGKFDLSDYHLKIYSECDENGLNVDSLSKDQTSQRFSMFER